MNLSLVRAAKRCHEKRGLAWLFANPSAGFLAAPSHRKLPSVPTVNASMDEFIRLLHTNGYDSKSSATFGAMAGPSERPPCEQDAQPQKRKECKSFLSNRRQPDRRLQAGTSPPADGRLGFEKQEIYNGKGGHN